MIKMAMGIEQLFGLQATLVNKTPQPVLFTIKITTGINDQATIGFIVQYIGIFLDRAEDKALDIPHVTNFLTIKGYFYGWHE